MPHPRPGRPGSIRAEASARGVSEYQIRKERAAPIKIDYSGLPPVTVTEIKQLPRRMRRAWVAAIKVTKAEYTTALGENTSRAMRHFESDRIDRFEDLDDLLPPDVHPGEPAYFYH